MSNVLMICGSLRKGSFNRALMNALPALAPADMKLTEAPSFRGFPLYDADLQAKGFPPDVTSPLGDFDQWPDGVEGIGHPREERVLVIPGKGRERVELGGRV